MRGAAINNVREQKSPIEEYHEFYTTVHYLLTAILQTQPSPWRAYSHQITPTVTKAFLLPLCTCLRRSIFRHCLCMIGAVRFC
jgi:hypothetical protein